MGKLIRLWERMDAPRRQSGGSRSGTTATAAELSFDLRCPYSYLAAEQLERAFDELIWTPASWTALHPVGACRDGGADAYRRAAEARAAALRLPLVWPERWPAGVPAAMRVAAFARERGRGGPFVLAAMRLAFCGGFDLDDPETLAEAAAAGSPRSVPTACPRCGSAARWTGARRAWRDWSTGCARTAGRDGEDATGIRSASG